MKAKGTTYHDHPVSLPTPAHAGMSEQTPCLTPQTMQAIAFRWAIVCGIHLGDGICEWCFVSLVYFNST